MGVQSQNPPEKALSSSLCRLHLSLILFLFLVCGSAHPAVGADSTAERLERADVLRSQWREASLLEAISIYAEIKTQSTAAGQHAQAAMAAQKAGDLYFILSKYQQALAQYNEARSFWRAARNRMGEMRALNSIGYVHVYLGKSGQALQMALKALSYYRRRAATLRSEDLQAEAEAENCAGEANYSLGKLRKSIEHLERALAHWTTLNDKKGQSLAILNLAYAYGDLGDMQKSHALFQQSLSAYEKEGDKRGEARALTGLGTMHSFFGQKQAALDKHVKAMEILRTIGDHAGEAIARNSIGSAYEDLNNLPTALDNYNQALVLYQQLGNVDFEAVTRYYLGRINRSLGNTQAALRFFEESAAQGQRRVTAYALTAISAIQSVSGDQEKALAQLKQVIRLYRDIGDRRGQANALNELGNISRARGNNEQALAYFEQMLTLYRAAGDKNGEAKALYSLALVEGALNRLDKALAHIKESNEAIEILRSQIVSPDLRASYYASVHKHAELYIDLLMKLSQLPGQTQAATTAFEVSEHSHARALLETLGEAAAQIREGVNPVLLEQERSLQQKLNAKALYQMRLLSGKPEPGELEKVARDIRELTTSYRELQTQIKQQSPRYANLVQPQPLKLQQIQSELDENTLLLEFSLGTERSFLWAVTKNRLTASELPARKVIEDLVKSVCALLVARQTIDDSDVIAYNDQVAIADLNYWKQAAELSKMLLGPVANEIKGKTILVVADDTLQYLSFDALPVPDQNIGEGSASRPIPLVLHHEFVTLRSASILATIRQSRPIESSPNHLIAILADPVFSITDPRVSNLRSIGSEVSAASASEQNSQSAISKTSLHRLPGTRNEAEAIMSIVPSGAGMIATGFDADRSVAVSGELGQYKLVHLATHGIVDTQNPELSGIMFSLVDEEGKPKDGFVQLHDIYNLNLSSTQLVVLSACETGLGKDIRGEGVVGLSRGFIYAGSSSVIASLWKVHDSATSELMTQFYKGIFEEDLTPSAALRKAKEHMWRHPRYHAPFYWAAFTLQGEYRERVAVPQATSSISYKMLLVLLISVVGLVLVILRVTRQRRRAT